MKNHNDFILSPITNILKDVISASAGISSGIETYPLCDYIMQSVFLKMTGFQEQKMKCICWELATNDDDYGYNFTQNKLGVCSSYKDKNIIYKDLIEQIGKCRKFDVSKDIDKKSILETTILDIINAFLKTNLLIWGQNDFIKFEDIYKRTTEKHFATDNNTLLNDKDKDISLKYIYEKYLYEHRNRCAHNIQSYQQNLPTLKILVDENYQYENYFLRFAILILIDKIFIELHKKYLEIIEDKI